MKVRELIELLQAVDPEFEVELEIDMHWSSATGINVNDKSGRVEISDDYAVERKPPAAA